MAEMAAETGLRIVGLHDRLPDRMEFGCQHINQIYQKNDTGCEATSFDDMAALINHPDVDLVLVTTHTNAHREPTIMALEAGKKVYLDKPISVTLEDAEAIHAAEKRVKSPVMMGFTRRYEASWREAVRHLEEGVIGDLQMVLLRSVIPYTRYLQLWHRDQSLSGGAINDKCSHHFDVLNWLAKSELQSLTAVGGRSSIFKPDPTAPKRCSECDRECAYRRHDTLIDKEEGSARCLTPVGLTRSMCATVTTIASICPVPTLMIMQLWHSPMRMVSKQTCFSPCLGRGPRTKKPWNWSGPPDGCGLSGRAAPLIWSLTMAKKHRVYKVSNPDKGSSHYGADRQLVKSLRAFADGEAPTVGVREGIASLKMVLATQHSISNHGAFVSGADMEVNYA